MLFQQALDPADLITPVLQDVVQATGESASYYVEQGGKRVCIYRVTSPHTVRYHIVPGMTMPFDRGAGGKMMLAFRRPYQPQFSAIRRKLVAHSIQEVGSDSAAISCPVFGMDGDLAGVISLTGPYTRFNREAQRRSTPILLAAARKCTLGLGGRWPTETQSLDDGTFGQLQVGGRK
jgi:DNA-binding IclR family transcriptional regulator